jgi:hypothetical protein
MESENYDKNGVFYELYLLLGSFIAGILFHLIRFGSYCYLLSMSLFMNVPMKRRFFFISFCFF